MTMVGRMRRAVPEFSQLSIGLTRLIRSRPKLRIALAEIPMIQVSCGCTITKAGCSVLLSVVIRSATYVPRVAIEQNAEPIQSLFKKKS